MTAVAAFVSQHAGTFAIGLVLTGILLLFLEFNIPGKVLPGCLGVLLLLGGLHRLSQLPLQAPGLAVACAGLLATLLALRFPSRGLFAGTGALLLVLGLPRLVADPAGISVPAALAFAGILGPSSGWLGYVAGLARRNKFTPGLQGMRGKLAIATDPLLPGSVASAAHVAIAGELWPATLAPGAAPVAAGATLLVTGVRGNTLLVRAAPVQAKRRPRPRAQSLGTR